MTQQTSPTPPKVGRPDGLAPSSKGAPENVRDGVRAWYIVGAVQALTAVVQLVMNLQDPRALTTQVRDQMDSVSLPDGVTEETLVTGTAILNLLLMLAAVALCMFLNRRVSRGGVRSRLFLCVGSVYLALMALVQVFSTPPDTGATPLVLLVGAGTIVSGVVAAVGIWLITRPENADWFGLPDKAEIEAYAEKLARRNEQLDKERAEKKKRRRQAREDRDPGKNAGTNGQENGQKNAEKKNRGR
ncbi:hypothetical protein [Corynebacterium kalidii]|uniref:Uncharacterized protein n=1 Tax=Corynebacterium kalidii TaxID=2931982 RepID=A0A9X2AYR8_9CORY|nr:hypothetical protein [Corynebacterium kalidii]MCJ7857757.1 hypothetical protein [Corynebacterium kalidii]